MWKKIRPYIISPLIALAVGGLSAFVSRNGMEAYQNVVQPPLSPPMWLFPVVWSILYILMGTGSAIIYTKLKDAPEEALSALIVYGFQLAINFFWSIIFFNMQAFLFAFIWLVVLWLLIIAMTVKFSRLSRLAAWLQLPYLLWVTFAGYLTLMVWLLNK
ncbi:MAG: tryptophan-rich sensory protein [Clostridia bacterium]|nr:tryptophan-rich sensory protein [Clostridia bacterium]